MTSEATTAGSVAPFLFSQSKAFSQEMGSKISSSTTCLLTLFILLVPLFEGRVLPRPPRLSPTSLPSASLLYRLKLDEKSSTNCWDSLMQLQACTGELILFFLNGETYLGPGCCKAIRTVGHHCWPGMLETLGFTPQEGDILQGYCDDHDSDDGENKAPPPPPSFEIHDVSEVSAP